MLRNSWTTIAAYLFFVSAAPAQDEAFVNAFSGSWEVYDGQYRATREPCSISLSKEISDGFFGLSSKNCRSVLAEVDGWGIVDNQLALVTGQTVNVRLGGNQNRISGEALSGDVIVLERSGTAKVLSGEGCIYLGYTDKCSEPADRLPPLTDNSQTETSVGVLVKLNIRSQPRPDAPVVTELLTGICAQVDQCVTASEGVWCRLSANGQTGWARQVALRQSRWLVVTYSRGCDKEEASHSRLE